MRIAILTPSRGRPEKLSSFVKSVHSLANETSRVLTYTYVDNDDLKINSYKKEAILFPDNNHLVIGPPQSVSISWNVIAKKAIEDKADILIMGNDDMVYRTVGWDDLLELEVLKFPDRIFCMWFEDLNKGPNHCAFPIVSKEWYETLGYFTPGHFHFAFNDTWIFDIASKIKREHFIPYIINEHLHYTLAKMEADETTYRARLKPEGQTLILDRKIFIDTAYMRKEAAAKLLAKMSPLKGLKNSQIG